MILEFILSLIPVSLVIYGIHILFQEHHLLESLGWHLRGPVTSPPSLRSIICKPLFDCPICMSSFWGTVGFFAMDYVFGIHLPWRHYIAFIFALCGLQAIINKLISKERVIVEE